MVGSTKDSFVNWPATRTNSLKKNDATGKRALFLGQVSMNEDKQAQRHSILYDYCRYGWLKRVEQCLNEHEVNLLYDQGDLFRIVIAWNKDDILKVLLRYYTEQHMSQIQHAEDWVNCVGKSKLISALKLIYEEVEFSAEVRTILKDFFPLSSVCSVRSEDPTQEEDSEHQPNREMPIDDLQLVLSSVIPCMEEIIWDYLGPPLTEQKCSKCGHIDCIVISFAQRWCLACGDILHFTIE